MTTWHYRKQIKKGFRDTLLSQTIAMDRVEIGRRNGVDAGGMPMIAIYATDEAIKRVGESPLELERTLTVVVECYTAKHDGVDGDFDTLSGQVEALINDINPTLIWEGVSRVSLLRVEAVNEGEKASQAFTYGALTFEVIYNVASDDVRYPEMASVATISNLTPPPGAGGSA